MSKEIERKFIVSNDSWKELARGIPWHYSQGYLSFGDATSPEARVRVISPPSDAPIFGLREHSSLTFKSVGGITRDEVEMRIDIAKANELMTLCHHKPIEKVRYRVHTTNGSMFEIDVYGGGLAGLVIAEIELPSEDAPFDQNCGFLGDEVSTNKSYRNSVLAREGLPLTHKVLRHSLGG